MRLTRVLSRAVKFADLLAQTLSTKAPREWEEYQDWLHDILLDRHRVLELGIRSWQVAAIADWRLIGLCCTVTITKLRRLAKMIRRS